MMRTMLKVIAVCACFMCPAGSFGAPADPVAQLKALPPGQSANVVIPPGMYRLPPEGLSLEGLKDVHVSARGVTFLAVNPQKQALCFVNCTNLSVEGLTIDYDPLPFTQGTLTAVDPVLHTADFTVHDGYPELSDPYLVNRFHLFDAAQHHWKVGAPDYYVKKVERLSAREGRIYLRGSVPGFASLDVGDRIALNIRTDHTVKIMDGCKDITFRDVTIHTGPGLGVLVRFAETAGTFENLRIVPGPPPAGATQERLLSTCADAFNAAYSRKGPVLDGCEFAYMGDDSVNLHGVTLPVLRWEDARTCLSVRPAAGEDFHELLRAGDEVRFLSEPDYRVVKTAVIEEISGAEASYDEWEADIKKIWPTFRKNNSASFYRVRLTEEVDLGIGGVYFESFASSAPEYVIKNCYFHDHRGRGLRLMTGAGRVENNRFERIKGAAISMGPEIAYWKEAGWVQNVMVCNNVIRDVGQGLNLQLDDSYTLGAISVFSHVRARGEQTVYYPGNRDLVITDNQIGGCSVDGIHVSAARDVMISGNTIRRVNQVSVPFAGSRYGLSAGAPVTVQHSEHVVVKNNDTGTEENLTEGQ